MHVSPFAASVPGKTVKLPQCVVKMVYTHWSLYYLTGLRRLYAYSVAVETQRRHSSAVLCVELNSASLGLDWLPKARA